jgi:hypothetical protein
MAAGGRGRESGVALVMRSENLGKEGVRVCRFMPARVGRGMVMAQEPLLRSKTPRVDDGTMGCHQIWQAR